MFGNNWWFDLFMRLEFGVFIYLGIGWSMGLGYSLNIKKFIIIVLLRS